MFYIVSRKQRAQNSIVAVAEKCCWKVGLLEFRVVGYWKSRLTVRTGAVYFSRQLSILKKSSRKALQKLQFVIYWKLDCPSALERKILRGFRKTRSSSRPRVPNCSSVERDTTILRV